MEDIEIIEEEPARESYRDILTEADLKLRRPVWQAMSEIWLHEDITDYDLNYIAIRLSDTEFSSEELRTIFYTEVVPVVKKGQYIMNSKWFVIEANWLEDSILKHLYDEKKRIEARPLSTKLFHKIRSATKRKKELVVLDDAKVVGVWGNVDTLIFDMRQHDYSTTPVQRHNLLPSVEV